VLVSGVRVSAVVVTYRPDTAALAELLRAVQPQVSAVVVVHNGADAIDMPELGADGRVAPHTMVLGRNWGVAYAQNQGIQWAFGHDSTHVLLLDQDSLPAADMVERLLEAEALLMSRGERVAAVGPRYLDERQDNPPPFIQIRGLRLHRQRCIGPQAVVPVDYLVSSGCLLPRLALETVGPMKDDLFIDYVDIEWGLRAQASGFASFGACGASMRHALGEQPLRIFGRARPVHAPLRHYYLFRNAVWLYRQPGPPTNWKWVDGWRLVLKFGAYALLARPRATHLRMMLEGIRDGWRGRLGRYAGDA
jgi:rhamnosyltransferase